jgi:carboxyl-terminal processing protease
MISCCKTSILLSILAITLGLETLSIAAPMSRPMTGRVAQICAELLENNHYSRIPFDDEVSQQFLKNYFERLDYNRLIFLQSDIDEFTKEYGDRLDDLTLRGDASPAYRIYDRYRQRLAERINHIHSLIKENHDFTVEERFLPVRDKQPWPKTTEEINELWRLRIKYDILNGLLDKENSKKTEKQRYDEIIARVKKRYDLLLKTAQEAETDDIIQEYLTALSHAYDPHTDYFNPEQAENFSINSIKLKLIGIGAVLQSEDGYAKVKEVVPGGPADLSKEIKPGDRIVAVQQEKGEPVDVVDMRLNRVVKMIRGKKGTKVTLTIIPATSVDSSEKKRVTLVRNEIQLKDQQAKARIIEIPYPPESPTRLGVVVLPEFYEDCSKDVARLITRLTQDNISGLVLDLRRNGGGILEQAVEITGLFIPKGPVVQVRDSRSRTMTYVDDDGKTLYDGPLAVLVSRLSASASEIVAAALQDHGRALIVGDQSTHGKGTVQKLEPLERHLWMEFSTNPGQLKLTVSKFYRIAGGTTQKIGVTPDIILPSLYDYFEIGESRLPNALPPDEIAPASYNPLNRILPHLTRLQQLSQDRIQKSPEFKFINEDIQVLKAKLEDKSVSLSKETRIKEREEQKNKIKTREEQRKKLPPLIDKFQEISLDTLEKNEAPKLIPLSAIKKKETETNTEDANETASGIELEAPVDAQLMETLNILHDYIQITQTPKKIEMIAQQKKESPQQVSP